MRSYRPDIEGLRALAVVLVVLYHAGVPFLPGGYVGVDVFFVISGYLITSHLLASDRISLVRFYARRARRLLPMASVVALATLTATWLLTSALQTRQLGSDVMWAALFGMNLHLARLGVDYQAADQDASALQHFWSLAVEEQFYLAWPLLVLITWGRRRACLTLVLVVTVASFAYGVHETAQARALAYFLTPSRAWELGVGALLATLTSTQPPSTQHPTAPPPNAPPSSTQHPSAPQLTAPPPGPGLPAPPSSGARQSGAPQASARKPGAPPPPGAGLLAPPPSPGRPSPFPRFRRRARRWGAEVAAVAGLLAVAGAAVVLDDSSPFPGYPALIPALGTAAVLAAGTPRATRLERLVLDRAPVRGVGRVSYGLYLWHWPVLVLAPAYLGVESLTLGERLGAVTVALWIAAGTYFVLEDPLRRLPRLAVRPRQTLGLGAALVVGVAGVGLASSLVIADPLGGGAAAQVLDDGTDLAAAVRAGAAVRAVPSNLRPALAAAAEDEPGVTIRGARACHANIQVTRLSTDPHDYCVFGDPHGTRTVVLTGDSHAYQWLPAMVDLAEEHDWRLVSLTKAACPLYDVPLVNQTLNRDYTECYRWRARALARIEREKPALVVTSGAVFNPRAGLTPLWVAGVAHTVTQLRGFGARVVVVADTPFPGHDVPACLAEHLDDARACRVPVEEGLTDPQRRTATLTAARRAGATVVNPLRWLCASAGCPVIVGNTLVYRDNSHLTATYASYLAPLLDPLLTPPSGSASSAAH